MPNLEFFVIAESVSVDQSTNRLSLFNILEELQQVEITPGMEFPRGVLPFPQLVAATSWIVENEEHDRRYRVNLRLHPPGGGESVDLGQLEFLAERRRQRLLQIVVGCPICGPGEMRFEVLLDGVHKANHFVTVSQAMVPRIGGEGSVDPGGEPPSTAA
jgi:hypothetical protein